MDPKIRDLLQMLEDSAQGAGQGFTFGFDDELAGLTSGLSPTSGERASARGLNAPVMSSEEERDTRYQEARDSARRDDSAAMERNPVAFGAGEVLASLPAAFATGGETLGANVALSGAMGAAGGAGRNVNPDELLSDTAMGGLAAAGMSSMLGSAGRAGAAPGARYAQSFLDDAEARLADEGWTPENPFNQELWNREMVAPFENGEREMALTRPYSPPPAAPVEIDTVNPFARTERGPRGAPGGWRGGSTQEVEWYHNNLATDPGAPSTPAELMDAMSRRNQAWERETVESMPTFANRNRRYGERMAGAQDEASAARDALRRMQDAQDADERLRLLANSIPRLARGRQEEE